MKRLKLSSVGENLAKGLFDLMEKFLKFRINGWPVYKASSLLVHCPLISGGGGEECWCPNHHHQTPNTKPKFFSQTKLKPTEIHSSQLKSTIVNPTTVHQSPNNKPKFLFLTRLLKIILHCTMQEWSLEHLIEC